MAGSFGAGAFATLLATPCSAPFLGTAVGFALAGRLSAIVSVFVALGIGMALPYLALAAFPRLAHWLPRPGRWMLKVRIVLGFALAATGVWLLWVLNAQTGSASSLTVAAAMLLLWALFGWRHRMPNTPAWMSRTLPLGISVLSAVALASPVLLKQDVGSQQAHANHPWRPLDEAGISGEVAAGHTVFVDVTASWCVTCQVNKRMVIYQGKTERALFSNPSVTPMQADWTNANPAIGKYLASFGRYGIPFNAVYGLSAPKGIALSEVLTERTVLDALTRASASPVAMHAATSNVR